MFKVYYRTLLPKLKLEVGLSL